MTSRGALDPAVARVPRLQTALERLRDHVKQRTTEWARSDRGEIDKERYALSILPNLVEVADILTRLMREPDDGVDPGRIYERAVGVCSESAGYDFRVFQYITEERTLLLDDLADGGSESSSYADQLTVIVSNTLRFEIDRHSAERMLTLFAYCCAIHSLRKNPDSSLDPAGFVARNERTIELIGEPIAYFYKALATISDDDSPRSEVELRKGYEYSLAALERFPDQPGAHNLVAKYEVALMKLAGIEGIRSDLRNRALANVNRAIHLDPEYPTYYEVRSEVFLDQGRHDRAIIDLSIARSLAQSAGDTSLADSLSQKMQQAGMQTMAVKVMTQAQELNEEYRKMLGRYESQIASVERDIERLRELSRSAVIRSDEVEVRTLEQLGKMQTVVDQSRRDQLQIIALIAALLAIVQVGVTVAADAIGGGAPSEWRPWLLLTIPVVVLIVMLVFGFVLRKWSVESGKGFGAHSVKSNLLRSDARDLEPPAGPDGSAV